MQKIKPELIGKYIGFLYISKSDWFKDINTKYIELLVNNIYQIYIK